MRTYWLLLLLLGLTLSATWAERARLRDERNTEDVIEESDEDDDDADDDYGEEEVDVAKTESQDNTAEATSKNPCDSKVCQRGEVCLLDKKLKPKCMCISSCGSRHPNDTSFQVCSRHNVTYQSECELDRDHCLCRRQQPECTRPGTPRIRLDYYGSCQELTPCTDSEFREFPSRLREWLYIVMSQMAQRAEIPDYIGLLERARGEANHTHAVIWKFCDLDVDPQDRFVTRRELTYIIQALKALEHCLVPFLDECDRDDDTKITLKEWGQCLGLEEDAIKDECKEIRQAAEKPSSSRED